MDDSLVKLSVSNWINLTTTELIVFQKSKEEKKIKKKKHKHEDKGADLLEVQADDLVVQSEETKEVAAVPASTSAEVHAQLSPGSWQALYLEPQNSFTDKPSHLNLVTTFSVF